jgi:Flp pilus assembly protein TadD
MWDVSTGTELAVLRGHTHNVNECVFSPDGCLLASASDDKTVRLWEVRSGAKRGLLKGHKDRVRSCAFSPDGRILASAGWDKTVRLWDVHSKKELAVLSGHTHYVYACALSPDGRTLASASWDKTVRLWDILSGEVIGMFHCTGQVNTCRFNPLGDMLAAGDNINTVYLLDLIGFITGPIVITAVEGKQGFIVRCPRCQNRFRINKDRLGREIHCPDCTTILRLNPFIVGSHDTTDTFGEQETAEIQTAKEVESETAIRIKELNKKGREFFGSEDFEGAIECFEAVLKQQPKNSEPWILKLSALLQLGRREEAVQSADHVLENRLVAGEHLATIYLLKGSAQIGLRQFTEGLGTLEECLKLDDKNITAWRIRAQTFSELKDYQGALESYLRVRELEWGEETEAMIGMCYLHLDDTESAETVFKSLVEGDSQHPLTFYGYGLCLIMMDEPEHGCRWLRRFLDDPGEGYQAIVPQAQQVVERLC